MSAKPSFPATFLTINYNKQNCQVSTLQSFVPAVIHGERETEGSICVLANPDGVDQLGLEISPGGHNLFYEGLEDVCPGFLHLHQLLLQLEEPGPPIGSLPGFIVFILLEISQLRLHFVHGELSVKH